MSKRLLLAVFTFLSIIGFSQNHLIDFDDLRTSYLEKQISKEINRVRDSLGVTQLESNNYLILAARRHSKYMSKKEKIGHEESSSKHRTSLKRVKALGGPHTRVSELLALDKIYDPDRKKSKVKTYEYLAHGIVKKWMRKKADRLKLLSDWSGDIGVSLTFDEKTGKLYSCIVIGNEPTGNLLGVVVPRDDYGIKEQTNANYQQCETCFYYYDNKPENVLFGIQETNGYLVFVMNSRQWFEFLIQNPYDGFAIDIVVQDQFPCGSPNLMNYGALRKGILLSPRYYKNFKNGIEYGDDGSVSFIVGKVPEEIKGKKYECNVLILQNKIACNYHTFFNLAGENWELLDLPLKYDFSTVSNDSLTEFTQTKSFNFTIPFQKNKYEYLPEDIQPLFDSLKLANYNIESADIWAYASIEGSKEHNLTLQNKRAESIVKALTEIGDKAFDYKVRTAENWPEFYRAIKGGSFGYLSAVSQNQVKEVVAKNRPYWDSVVANHRKAVLQLTVSRKTYANLKTKGEALSAFAGALEEKDYERALALQERVKQLGYAGSIDQLVPNSRIGNKIKQNALIMQDLKAEYVYKELTTLQNRDMDNVYIRYNRLVLLQKMIFDEVGTYDLKAVKGELDLVRASGLFLEELPALELNYKILLCDALVKAQQIKAKDKVVAEMYRRFKDSSPLSDRAQLSLSKFLVYYGKFAWAEDVLAARARKLNASEDLLFFYLNLTIADYSYVKKPYYKEILTNAMNRNSKRFCHIFDAMTDDGITFQLLENAFLKRSYCDECGR